MRPKPLGNTLTAGFLCFLLVFHAGAVLQSPAGVAVVVAAEARSGQAVIGFYYQIRYKCKR